MICTPLSRMSNMNRGLTMRRQICYTSNGVTLYFYVRTEHLPNQRFKAAELNDEEFVLRCNAVSISGEPGNMPCAHALFTARFPSAALAARCTSVSWLPRRKRMGSRVSRPTGRTSFSVISAKASAALRWRSTLSEKESVVRAASGESLKKSVVVRSEETWKVGWLAECLHAGWCTGGFVRG